MRYFEYIIPCGIRDKQVTSCKRNWHKPMQEVKDKVKKYFAEVFKCEMFDYKKEEQL